MHQGVLVGLGTIEEVFRDPWHPYVASMAEALTMQAHNVEREHERAQPHAARHQHGAQTQLEEPND